MTCTRDDSTPCDCPSCEAAEDAFWREQEGDPDAPPEEYEFDVSDLDDVTPLPAAPHAMRVTGGIPQSGAGELTIELFDERGAMISHSVLPIAETESNSSIAARAAEVINSRPRSRAKRRR